MKVKERHSWSAFNEGKGGQRNSYDEFNKALKGNERNPKVKEYASMGMEEYHHYSERAEYIEEDDDDSKVKQQDNKKQNSSSNISRTTNIAKSVVGKVVAVVVGGVVVVTTYRTIQANEKKPDPTPTPVVISSVNWKWSNDYKSALVEFIGADGKVIKEGAAQITTTKTDATCNQEGSILYTGSIQEGDKNYTDSKTETLPALGHSFDEGHQIILPSGDIQVTYECSRCHEEYVVTIGVEENEEE